MSKANKFPRTLVGGVSLPRLIIGTNWFLGYSHTSLAKDKFIKDFQTRERIASVLKVFLDRGIDAVMGPLHPHLEESIQDAEQRAGKRITRIYTPIFDLEPDSANLRPVLPKFWINVPPTMPPFACPTNVSPMPCSTGAPVSSATSTCTPA